MKTPLVIPFNISRAHCLMQADNESEMLVTLSICKAKANGMPSVF